VKLTQIKAYEGRNIYSHHPVVAMLVDLEQYDGRRTNELPGFNRLLLQALPGLATHHCASSRPGGFVRRLEDGTFLGHVIEHVALELEDMVGWKATYGKTRQADGKGLYNVIFECGPVAGGLEAGRRAVDIVGMLVSGQLPEVAPHLDALRKAAEVAGLGPSTAAIAAEAVRRGIPVRRLGRGSLLVLGHGFRQRRVSATVTSRTSCPAVDLAQDKVMTKSVLAAAGIPTPPGIVVGGPEEAGNALETLGGPVVVKPADGNQGRGVSLNLTSLAAVREAYHLALAHGKKVLVEKQVFGRHYRLLVVDGKVVAAAERFPAQVVGDGGRTVRELVEAANRDPLRGEGHQRPLTRLAIEDTSVRALARQGLDPESVPEAGRAVILRENPNLSTGGTARDVTDEVHPDNARLAVRAACLVGLDVAGVDIVSPTIDRPLGEEGGMVLEVNAAPGLRMHLHPSEGRARDVAGPIVESLFPSSPPTRSNSAVPSSSSCRPFIWRRAPDKRVSGPWATKPGRIPIVAVTGTNGKTTVCRLIAHILSQSGLCVGLASTGGAWVGGERVRDGDCAGPQTAAAILVDPSVEAAVLETARGGIIRDGLAFDLCDVGLVTNISADHEGQDGLQTLEDLAYVKALVVETVARDGTAILNADDPFVHGMAGRARCDVVLFSRKPDNIVVRKHLLRGGSAVYPAGGSIVIEAGRSGRVRAKGPAGGVSGPVAVFPLTGAPLTLGGLLPFQVENAVAAVAAAWSLGVPEGVIRRALLTFGRPRSGPDYGANPGRLEAWRVGRKIVVLDYGHNRTAYEETLSAMGRLSGGDLLAVVGAPGDRKDEHLLEMGRLTSLAASFIFIKEDADTRGRPRGEVASLFLRGVLNTGYPEAKVEVVLEERLAVERAVARARTGDWVIVFHEKADPLLELLQSLKARRISPVRLARTPGREALSPAAAASLSDALSSADSAAAAPAPLAH
jgi:cyanophycin synthetase